MPCSRCSFLGLVRAFSVLYGTIQPYGKQWKLESSLDTHQSSDFEALFSISIRSSIPSSRLRNIAFIRPVSTEALPSRPPTRQQYTPPHPKAKNNGSSRPALLLQPLPLLALGLAREAGHLLQHLPRLVRPAAAVHWPARAALFWRRGHRACAYDLSW